MIHQSLKILIPNYKSQVQQAMELTHNHYELKHS